jgi:hypothetical protein
MSGVIEWRCLPVVPKPNIESLFSKNKRKSPLGIRQAYPYLTVHEKTVVKIYYRLSSASTRIGLSFSDPGRQAVKSQQIAILGENNMFLGGISIYTTEIHKVSGIQNPICCLLLWRFCFRTGSSASMKQRPRAFIEPQDDGLWKAEDNKAQERFECNECESKQKDNVLAEGKSSD